MQTYLPEGMQVHTAQPETLEDLSRAWEAGRILTAQVLLCDEAHNLHVSVAGHPGVIPRSEAALGVAEGTVREVAILSRVGHPVACKVTSIGPDGVVRLSRAAAQREALDHLMRTARPGDILPAVVVNLAPFGAFCDVGCGVIALLGIENISVARIEHSADRFFEGQRICAVVSAVDHAARRLCLTHKELLGDWAGNAARFRPGQTVPGIVRGVKDYGVFVEPTPNLSGLAEPDGTLRVGDGVSVYIKTILPEKMKVKLAIIGRLDAAALPRQPLRYTQTEGHLDAWRYGPLPGKPETVFTP